MTDPSIKTSRRGHLGVIELNRPRSINALDHQMSLAMERALRQWEDDDEVAAVVVRGAGERGLCAGGDIVAIHGDGVALGGADHADDAAADIAAAQSPSGRFWRDEYRLNEYISRYPKPYIALMDGIVMGGGVGISAHGNTRIVTDRTRLAMPEVGIGFVPDVGGTHLLAQVPDQLGTYLALTAAPINGADAIALGLADHYIPADRLDDFVAALTDGSVSNALAQFATESPAPELGAHRDWIAEAFGGDDVAEIIERCAAIDDEFATKTASRIAAKSPMALAVTLRALRASEATTELADSLRREYRVSLRTLRHPDLAEGIRAQVIDKDRTPTWQPHPAVTDEVVAAFFAPLPDAAELTFDLPVDSSIPTGILNTDPETTSAQENSHV